MTIAVQDRIKIREQRASVSHARLATDGKFLRAGQDRFLIKGVTYGTFAPDATGYQFPTPPQVATDFRLMAELGINTVRTYTPPAATCSTRPRPRGFASWSGCRGRSMSRFSTIAG